MGWMQDIDAKMIMLGDEPCEPKLVNADEQINLARSYAADLKAGKSLDSRDVAYTLLVLAEFCEANVIAISRQ